MIIESQQYRLKFQHLTIRELTKDLDESFIKKRADSCKWSAFENIVHLTAYQPAFISRIENILENELPFFERYKAEDDPLFYSYLEKNLNDNLEILYSDRQKIFELITGLSEVQLNRVGVHLKYGNLTTVQWTEFFLLHESHHLFTVFKNIQELRVMVRV